MTTQLLEIEDKVEGPIPPRVANSSLPNVLHTRMADIVEEMGPPPWSKRIIEDERNTVTLIANAPGTGNRPHWHRDFDEYWFIVEGQLQWELTGGEVVRARKDDMVFVPRGTVHHITNVGHGLSLRARIRPAAR